MNKALIVVYGGGHVNIANKLIPLIINHYEVHILGLTTAYDAIESKSCSKYSITDVVNLFPITEQKLIRDIGHFFHIHQNKGYCNISINHSIDYLGLGFYELLQRKSFEEAMREYLEFGRHIFLQTDAASKFIEYIKPDIIITTTSPRFEKSFIITGNSKQIKTIQIDDLFGNTEAQFLAQNIIVVNETVKNKLVSRGIHQERIFPLGNLVFEEFIQTYSQSLRNSKNEKLRITLAPHKDLVYDDKGKIIFKGNDDLNHELEFKAFALLKSKGLEFDLFVRPHPNDDPEYYNRFRDIVEFSIQSAKNFSLIDSIINTDIWVTQASTTGIQASLLGKKVVTYNFRRSDKNLISIYEEEPFYFSKSLETLHLKILEAIQCSIIPNNIFFDSIVDSSSRYKEYFIKLL